MPPLGGPGPRRVNKAAVKRRERNLAKLPAAPKRAAVYVAPARAYKPAAAAAPRPTPAQLSAARAQERSYASQGRAIQKQATSQRVESYLAKSPATRRAQVKQIKAKPAEDRTSGERKVLDIHGQRQGADARQRKEIGALARTITPTYQARPTNVMPVAMSKGLHATIDGKQVTTDPNARVRTASGERKPVKDLTLQDLPGRAGLKRQAATGKGVSGVTAKIITNTPKDIGELATGTPTSLAHLAVRHAGATVESVKKGSLKPTIKAAEQTGKELVEPYKQLVKDPGKFITEHPVTTALMVGPTGRAAGVGIGRVARVGGKATLKRETATLPGTSLRQQRRYSPDVQVRAMQKRREPGTPGKATVTTTPSAKRPVPEIHRRVDEFFDWSQQKQQQMVGSALRDVQKERLPGRHQPAQRRKVARSPEFREAVEAKATGASGQARNYVRRQFAHEFGSTRHVDPDSGTVFKPKGDIPEGSGRIYSTKEHADKVVESLKRDKDVNWEPSVMHIEGETAGETGGYAVVPHEAKRRLEQHHNVGRRGWVVGAGLRGTSRAFRKAVLPTSVPWLMGQATEGALRGMVQGGGPLPVIRYRRGKRFLDAYERVHGKQAADELKARTAAGGHFGITGPAADFAKHSQHVRGFAHEVSDTEIGPYAKAFQDALEKPGVKHARGAYRRAAETIFNDINGPIERFYKTSMVGKQIKREPLLENRVLRLSDRALDEAARGMRGTSSMVQLGREIDRAYGKYSKHGPAMRDTILHTTPFLPWFLNMGRFLTDVLPRDHPVSTHLMASWNAADQEWRKKKRLSYYGEHVPDFMMGAYPTKGGKFIRAGRYMPFLPGDWAGAIGGQWYPQLAGAIAQNLAAGVDWKGQEIPGGPGRRISNAALTEAEALVPLLGQLDRATGLGERYVRGRTKKESVVQGKNLKQGAIDLVNPVKAIGEPEGRKKKGARRRRRSGGFGGGGGFSGGSGGGGFGGGGFRGS